MKKINQIMAIKKDAVVYGTSTLGAKGQIVIPAKMRKDLKLELGDTFVFVGSVHSSSFHVLKVETVEELNKALNRLLKAGEKGDDK